MGTNATINELNRIGGDTVSVSPGGGSTADIDIPQGEAVVIAWGMSTGTGDGARIQAQLEQDGTNDRQQVRFTEQSGGTNATVSVTVYTPR